MLEFAVLNWWAILVATVVSSVLGGIWYGPLFGQAWIRAMGKTPEEIEPSPMPFVVSFFAAGITATILAALVATLGIMGYAAGALLGLIVGLGFVATSMSSDYAFCGRRMSLFLIQSGYRVTYVVIMGVVLAGWPA